MKNLINRRLEIKNEIKILVEEKDGNKKLIGTKFEGVKLPLIKKLMVNLMN